jgi:hypothetical protein
VAEGADGLAEPHGQKGARRSGGALCEPHCGARRAAGRFGPPERVADPARRGFWRKKMPCCTYFDVVPRVARCYVDPNSRPN